MRNFHVLNETGMGTGLYKGIKEDTHRRSGMSVSRMPSISATETPTGACLGSDMVGCSPGRPRNLKSTALMSSFSSRRNACWSNLELSRRMRNSPRMSRSSSGMKFSDLRVSRDTADVEDGGDDGTKEAGVDGVVVFVVEVGIVVADLLLRRMMWAFKLLARVDWGSTVLGCDCRRGSCGCSRDDTYSSVKSM